MFLFLSFLFRLHPVWRVWRVLLGIVVNSCQQFPSCPTNYLKHDCIESCCQMCSEARLCIALPSLPSEVLVTSSVLILLLAFLTRLISTDFFIKFSFPSSQFFKPADLSFSLSSSTVLRQACCIIVCQPDGLKPNQVIAICIIVAMLKVLIRKLIERRPF